MGDAGVAFLDASDKTGGAGSKVGAFVIVDGGGRETRTGGMEAIGHDVEFEDVGVKEPDAVAKELPGFGDFQDGFRKDVFWRRHYGHGILGEGAIDAMGDHDEAV